MFFGRSSEISSLRALFSSKNAVISVVYGRRRIGKTSLVREAARGWVFYVFEGLEGESTSAQKRAFLEQLACYGLEIPSEIDARSSWQSILALLTKLVDLNESTVILLDEFQWLANYRTELVSQLKLVWDKLLSKHRTVKLVLCGSIASFLLKKVVHSKALYGRTDLVINLQGFSLSEAKQMLQGRGVDEVMLAYSLVLSLIHI